MTTATSGGSTDRVDPHRLLDWFRERQEEMVAAVAELAAIESPSGDGGAQEPARAFLTGALTAAGFTVERLEGRDGCDHLLARMPDLPGDGPGQLVMGHLDTVWPVGTLTEMPVEEIDGRLHGPGTFDMKGGLIQALFAFRAIGELGLELPASPSFLIVADEEIGSPDSRRYTMEAAGEAARCFVVEPAFGPEGELKTHRKGVGQFSLTVKGVASHAGLAPEAGTSAILEASRQIERLFELNDPERGISVNVGTVDGGLGANVVAPEATAQIETRVETAEDAVAVEEAIKGLAPTKEECVIEVEGSFRRPPLEKTPGNRLLWEEAVAAAGEMGLALGEASVGGASDGNLTSTVTATLDGLGAVGDGAHAEYEHLVVEKLPERAALLAALLTRPLGQ